MSIKDKIWAEKYRPNLESYIFSDTETQEMVERWISRGVIPNLILAGIQGTGKSSLAYALADILGVSGVDFIRIDGSVHNKVEDIRSKVIRVSEIAPMGEFKIFLIEEAHRLSRDAQSCLLETVEKSTDFNRFIFTTNYPKKLLEPIQSRCTVLGFYGFNEESVISRCAEIMEAEGVDLNDENLANLLLHVDTHKPDIRSIINSMQEAVKGDRLEKPAALSTENSADIERWKSEWMKDSPDYGDLCDMCKGADSVNFESYYVALYETGLANFGEKRGEVVCLISDFLARALSATSQGIQSIHLEALVNSIKLTVEE